MYALAARDFQFFHFSFSASPNPGCKTSARKAASLPRVFCFAGEANREAAGFRGKINFCRDEHALCQLCSAQERKTSRISNIALSEKTRVCGRFKAL
jgi:hypothetical protein